MVFGNSRVAVGAFGVVAAFLTASCSKSDESKQAADVAAIRAIEEGRASAAAAERTSDEERFASARLKAAAAASQVSIKK